MYASDEGVALARRSRDAVLVGWLTAGGEGDRGLAALGVLRAHGPDAPRFLHSQVTHDVTGLSVGDGNLSARVTRTGHLVAVFSLHRVAEHDVLMVLEASQLGVLRADLDAFLFADEVELSEPDLAVLAVQGPAADDALEAIVGRRFDDGGEGACWPLPDVAGGYVLRRSITGDRGYLIAVPPGAASGVGAAVERADLSVASGAALADAVEILRIEAGLARVGADTPGKARRLHETGLEQYAVSYTKGCYLGQEVIARARTYGSVPRALRALVLADTESPEAGRAALARVPEVGSEARVVGDGRIGQLVSRTWSPVAAGAVVLAYIDRDHRTPGAKLALEVEGGAVEVTVALLPLYRAADQAARVEALYDRAIRTFAAGREEAALAVMEDALRLDPAFADGYEAIGVILGRSGRYHEAIDFFRRLEEVAPDEPMVNTNLSLYYMKLGDKGTAEEEAGKATAKSFARASADRVGHRSAADVAVEQREARIADARRKREMFGKVLAFDPEDPIALFGLGSALSTLGEWERAAEVLASASAVDRKNSAVYLAHGKALEGLDRSAEALAVYRAGMEVASQRGDLMPLKEMEHRALLLSGPSAADAPS